MKEETILVEYIRCQNGEEVPLEKWYALMGTAVEREGKTEVLKQIEAVCGKNCAWLRTDKAVNRYALECLSSGAYLAWKEFGGKPHTEMEAEYE